MSLLLAFKIDLKSLDENAIKEINNIIINYTFKEHFSNYHDKGWKNIGLITLTGDPYEEGTLPNKDYKKTKILKSMPNLEKFLDNLNFKKKRVRIMKLEKRSKIFLHFDRSETYDLGSLRLHIPIITNENVVTIISNQKYYWKTNEVWYADFSFPHKVENNSEFDRYHLVIDGYKNEFTDTLITDCDKQKKIRFIFTKIYFEFVQNLK